MLDFFQPKSFVYPKQDSNGDISHCLFILCIPKEKWIKRTDYKTNSNICLYCSQV